MSSFDDDFPEMTDGQGVRRGPGGTAAAGDEMTRFLTELRSLGDGPTPQPSPQLAVLLGGATPIMGRRVAVRVALRTALVAALLIGGLVAAAANHSLPSPAQRVVSKVVNQLTPFHIGTGPAHPLPATESPRPSPTGLTPSQRPSQTSTPPGHPSSSTAPAGDDGGRDGGGGSDGGLNGGTGEDSSRSTGGSDDGAGDGVVGGSGDGAGGSTGSPSRSRGDDGARDGGGDGSRSSTAPRSGSPYPSGDGGSGGIDN